MQHVGTQPKAARASLSGEREGPIHRDPTTVWAPGMYTSYLGIAKRLYAFIVCAGLLQPDSSNQTLMSLRAEQTRGVNQGPLCHYSRRLNHYQYHFEVYLRYMIL